MLAIKITKNACLPSNDLLVLSEEGITFLIRAMETNPRAAIVFLVLLKRMSRNNDVEITYADVQAEIGVSRATVARALAYLRAKSAIYVEREGNRHTTHIARNLTEKKPNSIPSNLNGKCYLYVLEDGTNSKIGMSERLVKRMKTYNTHNASYRIHSVFPCPLKEAKRVESTVKAYYRQELAGRSSEWFSVSAQEISGFVAKLLPNSASSTTQ